MHLLHDVTSTHELAFDVHLGDGWPVRVVLNGLPQGVIGQNVHVLILLDPVCVHENDNISAEAALWHLPCALHENADIVITNPLGNVFGDFGS